MKKLLLKLGIIIGTILIPSVSFAAFTPFPLGGSGGGGSFATTSDTTGVIPVSNLNIGSPTQKVPFGYFTNLNVGTISGIVSANAGRLASSGLSTSSLPINVKDYGAVGDNSTDDTVAIMAAFNVATTTYRSLYFPRGTYKITSTLFASSSSTFNCTVGTKECSFQIYGDGETQSIIKQYTSGQGGFSFWSDHGWDAVWLHDLSIEPTNTGTGIGVYIDGPASSEGNGYDHWMIERFKDSYWDVGWQVSATTAFNHATFNNVYLTYSNLGFWCAATVCESNNFHTLNASSVRVDAGKNWNFDGVNGSGTSTDPVYGAFFWFKGGDYFRIANAFFVNNGISSAGIRLDTGHLTVEDSRIQSSSATTSLTYGIAKASGAYVNINNTDFISQTGGRVLDVGNDKKINYSMGGLLGIGSSTPMNALAVAGTATVQGNIDLTQKKIDTAPYFLDCGRHFGGPCIKLYSRTDLENKEWGWGQDAGGGMQFYGIGAAGDHFSWNYGGAMQTAGTNELMRLTLDTNRLGIATTAPATTLSVTGSGYLTGGLGVGALNTTAGTLVTTGAVTHGGTLTQNGDIQFPATLGSNAKVLDWNQSYQGPHINFYHNYGNGNASGIGLNGGEIQFYQIGSAGDHYSFNTAGGAGGMQSTGVGEILRITTDTKRLGIGTTTPYGQFSVLGIGGTNPVMSISTTTGKTSLQVNSQGQVIVGNAVPYYGTGGSTALVCYMSDGSLGHITITSALASGSCVSN